MKFALKGAQVYLAGKIKGLSRDDVEERVASAGGTLVNPPKPREHIDLMLHGMNASEGKTHMCMALGIPIVPHDLAITLLEEGSVEIDPEEGKKSFDELIGPIRSLLSRALSRESWLELCAHVDLCKAEDVPKLITYLKPQLAERAARYQQHGSFYQGSDYDDFTSGELLPMPGAWIGEAMNGSTHPKLELCEMLTFRPLFVGSTAASRVFGGQGFSSITIFNTGYVNEEDRKKKSFYKKMLKAKNMANVHTLIIGADRDMAAAELLDATNLPGVTSLYLRQDMRHMKDFDSGAPLFFGPWASQLHTIGLSYKTQLDVLAARIDELPALEHLVMWCDDEDEGALLSVLAHIDRLTVRIGDFDASASRERLGHLLDVIARSELEELVVHVMGGGELGKELANAFVKAHVVDNGLIGRLERLVLHGQMDLETVEDLRERGLDVKLPAAFEFAPEKQEETSLEHVEQVPDGETERRAAQQVIVEDAMLFDTPCVAAWDVLVGVVDALEVQLDEAGFEQAITTLCEHLEKWPDELRILPTSWLVSLFDAQRSPKLDLVRTLHVSSSVYGQRKTVKALSRWIERLSRAPQIAHFSGLNIEDITPHKHSRDAAAMLVRQVSPETLRLDNYMHDQEGFLELIGPRRAEIEVETLGSLRHAPEQTPLSELQSKHIYHKVRSVKELEEVLLIEELDHVVSLTLDVNFMAPHGDAMPLTMAVSPARFEALRHLTICYNGKNHRGDNTIHRSILTWLSHARPVHVWNAFFTLQAVDNGLYERAYHSIANLPRESSRDAILELVSNPRFNTMSLNLENREGQVNVSLPELIDACHDTLRQNLRVLRWPATVSDLEAAHEKLDQLPNLSTFAIVAPDMHFEARRGPYLKALERLTSFHDLARMELYAWSFGEPEPFKAGEIKALGKLPGTPGDMLVQGHQT